MARISPLLLSILLLGGCFRYLPVTREAVSPGMTVRVDVSAAGSERIPPGIDGRREEVEGSVTSVDETRITILPQGGRPGDAGLISLLVPEVEAVERRELDLRRTFLVIGGGLALGVGMLFLAEVESGGGGGPPDGPDFLRIPVVQDLLPRGH